MWPFISILLCLAIIHNRFNVNKQEAPTSLSGESMSQLGEINYNKNILRDYL